MLQKKMFRKNKYLISPPKPKSFFRKILYGLLALILIYLLACLFFYQKSLEKNLKAYKNLPNFSPDLIAVFTGHSGRIHLALKVAQKFPNTRVLITGVHKDNTLESIIGSDNSKTNERILDIDYGARNTVENGISTLRIMRNNPGLKNVLIISHDYHLIRINMVMNKLMRTTEKYGIHFLGKRTNYLNLRNIKILSKEVIKLIRTYFLFLFWSPA